MIIYLMRYNREFTVIFLTMISNLASLTVAPNNIFYDTSYFLTMASNLASLTVASNNIFTRLHISDNDIESCISDCDFQ